MSKRYIDGLKPCPLCGGRGVFIEKKRKGYLTIGTNTKNYKTERFIKCENCNARTPARGKEINVINDWVLGRIYLAD